MTRDKTLDSLIAELEQAEGGSRELDWRIEKAVRGWPKPPTRHEEDTPHYTTNLQDALGLVDPKDTFEIRVVRTTPERAWAEARLYRHIGMDDPGHRDLDHIAGDYPDIMVDAATPALALTIAALKARREA